MADEATPLEGAVLAALSRCRFTPGSYEKRFVRDLEARRQAGALPLTERQRNYLEDLAYHYRRQLEAQLRQDMPEITWRERAAATIQAVFAANPEADEAAMRKLLRAAYPFGERASWPYTVWLSEVRRQLNHRYRGEPPAPLPKPVGSEARAQREAHGQLNIYHTPSAIEIEEGHQPRHFDRQAVEVE